MKKIDFARSIAIAFTLTAVLSFTACGVIDDIKPGSRASNEQVSLSGYFGDPGEGEIAVVIDYEPKDFTFREIDGRVCARLDMVDYEINDRFFKELDDTLVYTTREASYYLKPGADIYESPGGDIALDYVPYLIEDGEAYLDLEFVKAFSFIDYKIFDDDVKRIVMWRDVTRPGYFVRVKKDTRLRTAADITKPFILNMTADDELMYLVEEGEEFCYVMTKSGIAGYAMTSDIEITSEREDERIDTVSEKPDPNLYKGGEKVCLAWHQITNYLKNSDIRETLSGLSGVNVISPTWFYINDNEGNIHEVGSTAYVAACHDAGIQVWGLFSDYGKDDILSAEIFMNRAHRLHLEEQIMAMVDMYDLDGVNIDFEDISSEAGSGLLQFIRELSILCREQGVILSIDNYVPSAHTLFYSRGEQAIYADYVIVMCYDEHYSGSGEGSVASIGFLEKGVTNTLALGVPAAQLIQANPFYTRVWCETPKTDIDVDSVEAASEDFVSYDISSKVVSMREGKRLLLDNGADIVYLDEEGQNYGEYEQEGRTYKIWLEDETSVNNRMKVFEKYGLGGVAFWKVGLESDGIWELIGDYL